MNTKNIQKLLPINVFADKSKIDNTWEKYGWQGCQVLNTDFEGNPAGPSGMKIQMKKPKDGNKYVALSMPAGMAFVPNEPIDEFLNSGLEKRMKDFDEKIKKEFKIEKITENVSHNGLTKHWTVLTNVFQTVEDSHVKKDQVQLGFTVRNGYNTRTSLGVDIFTWRLACENGAWAKGVDLAGSTAFRHIGNPKSLLKQLQTTIMEVTLQWSEIMKIYNKMARTKLTDKIANRLWNETRNGWDINQRFFPKYFQIDLKTDIKKKQAVTLTNQGRNVSVWESFNDMTHDLWRAQWEQNYIAKDKKGNDIERTRKPMAFDGMVSRERKLHEIIKSILFEE